MVLPLSIPRLIHIIMGKAFGQGHGGDQRLGIGSADGDGQGLLLV